ncbi:MAG: YggT family protein [Solirubrobacterales bacterium]
MLFTIVELAFSVVYITVMIRLFLSFIDHDPYHPMIKLIYQISEPILAPFRKLPVQMGMFDFSPVLALLALSILQQVVYSILRVILSIG